MSYFKLLTIKAHGWGDEIEWKVVWERKGWMLWLFPLSLCISLPRTMCSIMQPIPETSCFKVRGVRLDGREKDECFGSSLCRCAYFSPGYVLYHANNDGSKVGWEGKGWMLWLLPLSLWPAINMSPDPSPSILLYPLLHPTLVHDSVKKRGRNTLPSMLKLF